MSTTTRPELAGDTEVSRAGLWFSLLGGAMAWLVHLLFAYGIAEFGCVGGLAGYAWRGISAVAWLLLALTAVTAVVALTAAFVGWRSRRRLGSGDEDAATGERDAPRAVAWAGLVTSGLFALTIVVESIPIFYYLQTCS
jgi:hypothetical protein